MRCLLVLTLALIMCWAVPAAEAQYIPLTLSRHVSGSQDSAAFGWTVAGLDVNGDGYGDVAIAERFFDGDQEDAGRVLVYLGSACGFGTTPWTAEGDQIDGGFGHSVANAGDVNGDGYDDLIVGANLYDTEHTDRGKVFLYFGSAGGLSPAPDWTAERNVGYFGTSVAGAGDVNGDSYDDVLVSGAGWACNYLGSATGPATTEAWSASFQSGCGFGLIPVSSAGDVNSDGYDDVVIGVGWNKRVYVYHGSPTGLQTSAALVIDRSSDPGLPFFGAAVAGAGDMNGDGYDDIVVGAEFHTNGEQNEGAAYLYLGSAGGVSPTPAWTSESNVSGARFGCSVAIAGDVNGDHYDDVIVGARALRRAYLFLGTSGGLSATANHTFTAGTADASGNYFGNAISGADVDGNGFDDVIIGAPATFLPGCDTGKFSYRIDRPGEVFVYGFGPTGASVGGVVLADGNPLENVTVDVGGWHFFETTTTDTDGLYSFTGVSVGDVDDLVVWIITPLGYGAVSPEGGSAAVTVCSGQSTTLDFALEQVVAGDVRSSGYWKHQVNVYWNNRGNAQESYGDITYNYPRLIYDHFFENVLNPIRLEGVTYHDFFERLDLESMVNTLNGHNAAGQVGGGNKWSQAAQQFLAVLLNVVSNRLPQGEVVSDDGATVSQAIQDITGKLLDNDEANDELAKDIAEAMNKGRMLDAGVIDQSRPTIYYARPMPSAPAVVGPIRVVPNPMVRASTLDFEMATEGRAEVRVFDVAGRVVRTLLDAKLPSGRHAAMWDGTSDAGAPVANGVYFYRVERPGGPLAARIVVLGEMR